MLTVEDSPQRTVAIRRRQKPMAEAEAMARPSSAVACYGGWIGDLLRRASIVNIATLRTELMKKPCILAAEQEKRQNHFLKEALECLLKKYEKKHKK